VGEDDAQTSNTHRAEKVRNTTLDDETYDVCYGT